jgi:uncharacterized NAD-dependent epimerase/dehydratase family protein
MIEQKKDAIVYCEGSFQTPNGKTAHGLVRFTERYNVLAVIDSTCSGNDSGMLLDGKQNNIPVVGGLAEALALPCPDPRGKPVLVIGLAPDGGRLNVFAIKAIKEALRSGMDVVSGLHDFITKYEELTILATRYNCRLNDIRKTPPRERLHFFSGKIEEVSCPKIAVLGTDSAVGKRTTAWIIVHGLRRSGYRPELIGTGQTAWLQGAKYSIILDSLINDFVSGEIEHAIHEAWSIEKPDLIVIEGQGSLMNPAYPGGFEILAAGRPHYIILQHAPMRAEYDGFPGYAIQPLDHQIRAIEILSGKQVLAVTINHEGMRKAEIPEACQKITLETGLPAFDVLEGGADQLVQLIISTFKNELQRDKVAGGF